jgi:hypothetical protein
MCSQCVPNVFLIERLRGLRGIDLHLVDVRVRALEDEDDVGRGARCSQDEETERAEVCDEERADHEPM